MKPSPKLERIGVVLLGLAVFGSLFWLVHPWYDPTNDGAMYILTGRSIAAGEGYSMLGIPFRIRPPGFSLLLAPILGLRGTDFYSLNLFVSLFGAAGIVLLHLYLQPILGWWLAALSALAVWLNPGYQVLCNQAMSDVPGSTLFLACLLGERWSARRPSVRRDLLLGAAVGLSAYVRTVNVLLVPALVAARLSARWWGKERGGSWKDLGLRLAALLAGAVLVQVPWLVRNHVVAPEPPADQTRLYSYGTGMFHEDMGDPRSRRFSAAEILARAPLRCEQLSTVLGSRLMEVERRPSYHVVTVVLVLCVLAVLVKRRASTEFFVVATLGVIAVYFGFAPRLLLPVYVLALPAAVEVVRDLVDALGRRLVGRRLGFGAAVAALAALIVIDFHPRRDWDRIEQQHQLLAALCEEYAAHLGADDRPGSNRAWHYAVFLERPVYSLELAILRAGNVAAAEGIIDKYHLNKILLSPARVKDREVLSYFEGRYANEAGMLARVYRVRP